MASLGEIQRLLRQQRAVGKPSSTIDSRALYQAFFDAQAQKNLQIGALELEREKTATQKEQFGESLAASESQFAENLALGEKRLAVGESQFAENIALTREQQEAQEEAAQVQGITQLGTLGFQAANTKIGGKAISGLSNLFGGPTASSAPAVTFGTSGAAIPAADAAALSAVPTAAEALAPSATTFGVSGAAIPAGDAAALSSTASAAPASGIGAVGVGSGIAAAAALDDILSRKVAGTEDDPVEAAIQKTRGITRFGGVSPLSTALIEKGLGTEGRKVVSAVTDPSELLLGEGKGVLAVAEKAVGTVIAATIPGFLGGGGSTGSKTVDKILNPAGTWLCTKTKETVGMDEDEWYSMGLFREYAYKNHAEWIMFYVDVGPELVESINGNDSFYSGLKETFLKPIIGLVKGGFMEAAYLTYKSVCIQLADKYKPELMEGAPGGENG